MTFSLVEAMDVMRDNVIIVDESEDVFGAVPSHNRLRVRKAQFDEATIVANRESHFLMLDTGASMIMMGQTAGTLTFIDSLNTGEWYVRKEFARRIEAPQWRLFPKATVPLFNAPANERNAPLCSPTTRQVVFATFLLWRTRKIHLLQQAMIRTRDVAKNDADTTTVVSSPAPGAVHISSTTRNEEVPPELRTILLPNHPWYWLPG